MALIPIWIFSVAPKLTLRIPSDWEWKVEFIGYQNWPDPATDEWTSDKLTLYEREAKAVRTKGNEAIIKDIYTSYDVMGKAITWQNDIEFAIDRNTGIYIGDKEASGSRYYYVFPRHTKKKEYVLWQMYLKKVPFSFVKEDDVEGLKTYLFTFSGDTEYTESYTGSDKYPGILVEEGQEIRSGDEFTINYWVEPVSGYIVKTEEIGAEDYIVNSRTKERISKVAKWGGKTTGDWVVTLLAKAEAEKKRIIFIEKYIPVGFCFLALILFLTTILGAKKRKPQGDK